MDELALLLHILGAFAMLAGTLVAGVAFEAARRRRAPAEIALLLGLTRVGVLLIGLGTPLVVAAGFWLVGLTHWELGAGWIALSIALLAATLVLGAAGGQRPKRARRLATRLAAQGTGETAELRALLDDGAARAANYLSALLLVAIVALMVFKPTF
jgi:uncharacterized membrane protein